MHSRPPRRLMGARGPTSGERDVMSIRRAMLVLVSVAGLLVFLSMPAAARQVPLHHPQPAVPSRPAFNHGNRVARAPRRAGSGNSSQSARPRLARRLRLVRRLHAHHQLRAVEVGHVQHHRPSRTTSIRTSSCGPATSSSSSATTERTVMSCGSPTAPTAGRTRSRTPSPVPMGRASTTSPRWATRSTTRRTTRSTATSRGSPTARPAERTCSRTSSRAPTIRIRTTSWASGNKVVFRPFNASHGREAWVSDGTPTGTKLLKDIQPGPDSVVPVPVHADRVAVGVHGERWPARLRAVGDRRHEVGDEAPQGHRAGHRGLVPGRLSTRSSRRSTASSTSPPTTASITPSCGRPTARPPIPSWPPTCGRARRGGNPYEADATNNALYVAAEDGSHGYELWKSDGTKAGTSMLKDIRPGFRSSDPYLDGYSSSPIGSKMLFIADDGVHGYELWVTNGTATGTKMVKDISGGSDSSGPYNFETVATGTDPWHGRLLHAENTTNGRRALVHRRHQQRHARHRPLSRDDREPSDGLTAPN